ncbi:MAG: AI-2E family transporter [Anaerolineales bacterium]|nr:AI-2E family transporter [Anaerolineales bacterium]MCX7607760.1 AI-2E family transporter [Anaerolineales bacterium]MDW8226333.1 AI-2E family transporter [Anaerolineales bacterium]
MTDKTWSTPTRFFVLGLIIAFVIAVAWWMRELFEPLILAGVIAYLLYPLVDFLRTRLRMNTKVAAHLVYFTALILMIALPGSLVPFLSRQAAQVTTDLLHTLDQIEATLARPVSLGIVTLHLEDLVPELKRSFTTFLTPLPEDAWHILESTSRGALWFLVVIVTTYYFVTDWDRVREWLIRLAPQEYQPDMRRLYVEIKQVWLAYLRGQLTLMVIVGITFSILWSIIGLPGAVLLGIIGGLLSIIPDVGPFAATALAVIVALLEGSTWMPVNNFLFALIVAGLYVVLINVKNVWLRPYILGRSVHMHEGVVFVAIIAAVVFTGILGAFIIVPVLASLAAIGRYLRARLLGLDPFAAPPEEETPPTSASPPLPKRLFWQRRKKETPHDEN